MPRRRSASDPHGSSDSVSDMLSDHGDELDDTKTNTPPKFRMRPTRTSYTRRRLNASPSPSPSPPPPLLPSPGPSRSRSRSSSPSQSPPPPSTSALPLPPSPPPSIPRRRRTRSPAPEPVPAKRARRRRGRRSSDAEQRKEDARTQRMNAEQKRRDLLRDGYDRLQSVLPQAREKLSKVKLIEAATHHIVRLTNEQEDRSARLSRLIAERDELQRRNEIISQALSTNSPIPSDVMEPLPQDPVAHGNHVPKDSGPSGTGPPSRGHGSSSGSGLNLTPAAHRPVPISASGRSSRRFEGSASDASGSGVGYTNGGGATKAESKGGDLLDDEMSDL